MAARRPATFKQNDVKRACRGVVAAGLAVGRVEIDTEGKIIIIPGSPDATDRVSADPLENWLDSYNARSA